MSRRHNCPTADAYHQFRTAMGNRTCTGKPMPAFHELPRSLQAEWKLGYRIIARWKQAGMPAERREPCPGF